MQLHDAIARSNRKVIALDDDPTGVQTVHDLFVLTRWDAAALDRELADARPCTFVLTNSRSLPAQDAATLNREIAELALTSARHAGREVAFLSRSDSTLRGHVAEECAALADTCGDIDGIIVCPAFFEGGRITCSAHHFQYDANTGHGVNPKSVRLLPFPVRVDAEAIFVDVAADGQESA